MSASICLIDPNTISHYNTLSNAGIGALVGGAAGMWLLSYPSHNEHWRETGLLAGEAALNSLVRGRGVQVLDWAGSGRCRETARGAFLSGRNIVSLGTRRRGLGGGRRDRA